MSTIFPLSASVGQEYNGYTYDGTIWNLNGNEYNPTTFSSTPPANPKPGDLWVDSDSNVDILNEANLVFASELNNYVTQESASTTYATINYVDGEINSIDLSNYLTTSSASSTYATQNYIDTELSNIDLTSAINTASAAAVTYLVDSAPSTLDTLNELAAALGDDENYATTITNLLSEKLSINSASNTYLTQISASTMYQKYIPYQSSAPESPESGDLWVDSSTSTPALKTYNGSSWVQLGSSVNDTQSVISGRMFI